MPTIIPLSDQAALLYFVDETAAAYYASALHGERQSWVVDVVQAYTSVAVFFDLDQIRFAEAAERLESIDSQRGRASPGEIRVHEIPCCYELEQDLGRVSAHTGLKREEIIRLHAGPEYAVYAIGFCPGFPYLGYLPPLLCGVPRLEAPRLRVAEGSVGLTGRQTGIYTEDRPGGWNIIGRTPLQMVHVADSYFPLRTGDRIRFRPISPKEFQHLSGRRLE